MKHIKLYELFSSPVPEESIVDFTQSGNSRFFEGDVKGETCEIRPANHIVGDEIEIFKVPEWDFSKKGQIAEPIGMGEIISISSDYKIYSVKLTDDFDQM
jgi:hypothetical protein